MSATPNSAARPRSESRYRSPSRASTRGWVWPATTYSGAGSSTRSPGSASIPHSTPLPGPRSPQVSTTRRPDRLGARSGRPPAHAPCGMTTILRPSTWYPASSRWCPVLVIVHDIGEGRRCFQDVPLVRGRGGEHGVQHDDQWDPDPLEHLEYLVAVRTTETGVPGGTTCVRPGRCASTCGRGTKCPPPVDSRMLRSAKPRHRSRGGAAVDGTGGRAWNPDGRGASGLLLRRRGRRRYGQRVQGRRTSGLNRGRAQCPVGGISAGLSACLAFFAARFSFRVLPGFFTLLFCGDLLDTTVLPHNIRMVRSDAGGTRRVHQPRPSQLRDPEQTWSDGHVISLTPIAPRPAGRRSARPVPPRRRRRAAPGVPARPEPLIVRLASMTVEQRATLPGVRRARARQILAGAIVAHTVMSSLDLARVERSARGLREGILLRRLSPLLTADSLYQIELIQAERKETYGSLAAVIVFPGLAVDL